MLMSRISNVITPPGVVIFALLPFFFPKRPFPIGDLTEIFDDIINCGVDAINPIEPTTANPDYDIFKLNEKYGDKITFAGNLSPTMLATGEISEIEEYAKKLIRELAPGGGYIFSSGHSINPAVTVDRFEAMHNIRKKFENYPINVLE